MKRKVTKDKLAKTINNKYARLANYLKRLNKTKTLDQNYYNIIMTLVLHRIFFSTITTKENTEYFINYIKDHYLRDCMILSKYTISKTTIDFLILKTNQLYKTEEDVLNVTEEELLEQFSIYGIDKMYNLKDNLLKVYEAIKKEYNSIEIIE